jgi:ubiquinone/menaquinone biosynthesis C-methylase UbiE
VTESTAPDVSTEMYDEAFRALHGSDLLRSLWAEAMQDQYPVEVEPFSSCSWWLLGRLVAELRLRPGAMLVDLGCGRGGPGLWLARALSAGLTSIDHSAVAVELAASRAPAFVGPDRASFRLGTFDSTGLPDGAADAVISMDALPFAPDRDAALREVARILAPGGRVAFTANQPVDESSDAPGSWEQQLVLAGLHLESRTRDPHSGEHWRRLYGLWTANADGLREELGETVAEGLLNEAATVEQFATLDAFLFVASRPGG